MQAWNTIRERTVQCEEIRADNERTTDHQSHILQVFGPHESFFRQEARESSLSWTAIDLVKQADQS